MTVAFAVFWLSGLAISLEQGGAEIALSAASVMIWIGFRIINRREWRMLAVCCLLLLCACAYGLWKQSANHSRLPSAAEGRFSGIIASPVKAVGDRVRFEFVMKDDPKERLAVTVKLQTEEQLRETADWRQGDQATLSGALSVPQTARNFGQFDYADYLSRGQIHRLLTVKGLESVNVVRPDGFSVQKSIGLVEAYRQKLSDRVEALFPGEQSGFMQGMLIGVREDMTDTLFNRFSRLGLTHIIAISGLHVAIVVGGWLGLLRLLRVTKETALLSALFLIPLYVVLSGASPSVVRSGMMAMIAIYAARRGWLKDALQIMALTVIAMTAWNPYLIYDVGFQLSFIVTAGLIAGVPSFRKLLPQSPGWLHNAVAVTAVAQVVSFPLTIHYFNQFSGLSGLANFVLVPLFSLITLPIGYVSLLLSFIYKPFGVWSAKPAIWCNDVCFWLMERLDSLPGFRMIWPSPPLGAILLYFVILYAAIAGIERYKMKDAELFPRYHRSGKYMLLGCMLAMSVWSVAIYGLGSWGGSGTVSFIDVGQGDSILIRTPADRTILIDGGGTVRFMKPGDSWRLGDDPYEVGKDLLVPLLKKRGVRQIDYLIATHADADHIGGLQAVLEDMPVKRMLFNGTLDDSPTAKKLFRTALAKDIPLFPVSTGRKLVADKNTVLTFLYPFPSEAVRIEDDQNETSVVFELDMYGKRFLFTGDMGEAEEKRVIESLRQQKEDNKFSTADVLKVAHHGSKTSTSELWLNFWKPRMAVISVGQKNVYRHPSPIVTERLAVKEITVFRTDRHGEIQLKVDEGGIRYRAKFR